MRTWSTPSPRSRALILSVTVFVALLAGLSSYQAELSKRLGAQQDAEASIACAQAQEIFKTNVTIVDTAVADMALFLESSQDVGVSAEQRLALQLTDHRDGLDALAVVQVVKHADRARFEAKYLGGRSIRALDSRGNLVTAPKKPEYYVIRNIAPIGPNRSALGLDMLSEPRRRSAIMLASSQRKLVHSEPLVPVQDALNADLCNLVISPVLGNSLQPPKLFVSAVFRVPRVATDTNKTLDQARIVQITDITRPRHPVVMWTLNPLPIGTTLKNREAYLSGRMIQLAIEPLSDTSTTSNSRSLQLMVWIFGVATCLLFSILVSSILFKRIQADEHRKQLQDLATDLLTEISEKPISD